MEFLPKLTFSLLKCKARTGTRTGSFEASINGSVSQNLMTRCTKRVSSGRDQIHCRPEADCQTICSRVLWCSNMAFPHIHRPWLSSLRGMLWIRLPFLSKHSTNESTCFPTVTMPWSWSTHLPRKDVSTTARTMHIILIATLGCTAWTQRSNRSRRWSGHSKACLPSTQRWRMASTGGSFLTAAGSSRIFCSSPSSMEGLLFGKLFKAHSGTNWGSFSCSNGTFSSQNRTACGTKAACCLEAACCFKPASCCFASAWCLESACCLEVAGGVSSRLASSFNARCVRFHVQHLVSISDRQRIWS